MADQHEREWVSRDALEGLWEKSRLGPHQGLVKSLGNGMTWYYFTIAMCDHHNYFCDTHNNLCAFTNILCYLTINCVSSK